MVLKTFNLLEYWCILIIEPHQSGFHMLTQELSQGVIFSRDEYKDRLQQMFPKPVEEEDGVKSLSESYLKYKREYVKHLNFNPKEESLSNAFLRSNISLLSVLEAWIYIFFPPSEDEQYICSHCGEEFEFPYPLRVHLKYRCPYTIDNNSFGGKLPTPMSSASSHFH